MFKWDFALRILPRLFHAMGVTVWATFAGMAVALVLGLIFAVGRRSKSRLISRPIGWFVEFIRSTPLLVQLYFLYFILPKYGIKMSALVTGIIGLGLHYSAYTSEVYRAGIEAIVRGQWEAAIALNFSPMHTWAAIILPQAIPPMIPTLGNYLIAMFKDTPTLSAITVVEMLLTAKIIGSHTFRYLEPFSIVGLLFLAISYPSALLIGRLERIYSTRGN